MKKNGSEASRAELRRRHHRWQRIVLCLAIIVAGATFMLLSQQGQAKTHTRRVLTCSEQAHVHTRSCYDDDGDLICGYADYIIHTHNDDCYDEDGNLVCRLPKIKLHEHDDSCYGYYQVLTCGLEESAGHAHTDACKTEVKTLVCGMEEGEGAHVHTDDCYTETKTLTCGLEESEDHQHTEDCYTVERELTCGLEESEGHVHTDDCYETTTEYTCGMEEGEGGHTHTSACYSTEWGLICTEQTVLHTHTNSCYDKDGNRICGLLELKEHIHGEGCFTTEELTDDEVESLNSEEDSEAEPASIEEPVPHEEPEPSEEQSSVEEPASAEEPEPSEAETPSEEPEPSEAETPAEEPEPSEAGTPAEEPESSEAETPSEEPEPSEAETPAEEPESSEEPQPAEEPESSEEPQPAEEAGSLEEPDSSLEDLIPADEQDEEPEEAAPQSLTAEDASVAVTVTASADGELPAGAEIAISRITENSPDYEDYTETAEALLDIPEGAGCTVSHLVYDIKLLSGGEEIEPDGSVTVTIESKTCSDADTIQVVHYPDAGEPEVMETEMEAAGDTVSFETDGFSVYTVTQVTSTTVKAGTAVTYQSVLGEAQYYGIVADTLYRSGHIDSNAAVKNFVGGGDITLGNYTGGNGSANVIGTLDQNLQIHGSATTVYAPADVITKLKNGNSSNVTYVEISQSDADDYVQSLMDSCSAESQKLLQENTYSWTVSNNTIDLTSLPDGTYYLDASMFIDSNGYWRNNELNLKLNDGQNVVINFTNSAITSVNLGRFKINGSSTTGSSDYALAGRVVWNMPYVTSLGVGESLGIFLAPNAVSKTNATSSGWIVAKSLNTGGGEWHFINSGMPNPVPVTIGAQHYSITSGKTVAGEVPAADEVFSFKLEKWTGSAWTAVETVQNSGGAISFSEIEFKEAGTTWYRITEVSGTEDYYYDSAAYAVKVVITKSGTNLSKEVTYYDLGTVSNPAKVADSAALDAAPTFDNVPKYTSLSVKKYWTDAEGSAVSTSETSLQVQLYRAHDPDDSSSWSAYGDPVTLTAADSWSYSWTKLPAAEEDGTVWYYKVAETVPDGWNPTYSNNDGITSGEITITNVKLPESDTAKVKVNKVWLNQSGEAVDKDDGSVDISLYQIATTTKTAAAVTYRTLTVQKGTYTRWGSVSYSTVGTYDIPVGASVTFQVNSSYYASYTSGTIVTTSGGSAVASWSGATYTLSSMPDEDLTAKVVTWGSVSVSSSGGAAASGNSVTVSDPILYGTVTLSSDIGWNYEWTGLPHLYDDGKGTTVAYTYYVEESSVPEGYAVSYSGADSKDTAITGGEVTVYNTDTTTVIEVNKEWFNLAGTEETPETGSITFSLYQGTARGFDISEGECLGSYTLSSGSAEQAGSSAYPITAISGKTWAGRITGLPSTDAEGNTYYYKVVEEEMDGYAVSYRNNDGVSQGTIAICNTSATINTLPSTGGSGTGPYLFGGMLLMLMGSLLLAVRLTKARREGRAE